MWPTQHQPRPRNISAWQSRRLNYSTHPIAVNYSGRRRSGLITKKGWQSQRSPERTGRTRPPSSSLCGLALMKTHWLLSPPQAASVRGGCWCYHFPVSQEHTLPNLKPYYNLSLAMEAVFQDCGLHCSEQNTRRSLWTNRIFHCVVWRAVQQNFISHYGSLILYSSLSYLILLLCITPYPFLHTVSASVFLP